MERMSTKAWTPPGYQQPQPQPMAFPHIHGNGMMTHQMAPMQLTQPIIKQRTTQPAMLQAAPEKTSDYVSSYGGRYQPKPRATDRVLTPNYQSREPTRTPRSNNRGQSSGLDVSVADGRGSAPSLQWSCPKERINVLDNVQYPRSTGVVDVTDYSTNPARARGDRYRTYSRNTESVYPYSTRGSMDRGFVSYRDDPYYRNGTERPSVNGSCTQS